MKSKGDIVGGHFLDIWHPDFKQEAEKHLTAVLNGHQSTFEAVRHKGDDFAWWSVKLRPVLDSSNNQNAKFILFGSNISEEKTTKTRLNSLRNAEERYFELKNILNSMLDPVHITNKDYEIEFVNRACTEVFGFYTAKIKCFKYFHNFDSPCEWCRHEEVMMGSSYQTENYFEKTKTYFHGNHSPITKANGEIAKLVILRDITERKNAEEALRESEERFQALFYSMAEGVAVHEIVYDENGAASDYVIVKVNHAYEVLTGIAINEAEGKRASELYGTGGSPFFDIYVNVVETGEPHDFVTYFEPMNKYFRISVFTPGKGKFATVFDDITESRKNEEERRKSEALIRLNEDRLETLLKLTMLKDSSEKEIADFALEEGVRLTRSKGGYLHFFNEDEQSIQLYSWSKDVLKTCKAAKDEHYPLDKAGIWADSVRLKRPVIHNDYQNLNGKKGYPEGHFHLVRHLGVPIFDGDRVVGVSGVSNKEEPYTETDAIQINLFMNSMWRILKQKRNEEERNKLINELKEALANVKQLSGLLPICSYCKKIRNDKGYWSQIESYITEHTNTLFSHSMCPDCAENAIKKLEDLKKKNGY